MARIWLNLGAKVLEEALAERLKALGHEVVPDPQKAQLALVFLTHLEGPPPLPATLALLASPHLAEGALRLGYRGYLYPHQGLEVLEKALPAVARGEVWAERRLLAAFWNPTPSRLTPREELVAHLAAEGLSNREIAQRLGLSEKTVKAHLSSVFAKLGVRRRVELVLRLTS
jgi:DNA-binding NarL/FixJ family response regulator